MHLLVALNEGDQSRYAFEWLLKNIVPPNKGDSSILSKVTIMTVVEPPVQASYYYAASGAVYTASYIEEVYQKATEAATKCVRTYQHALHAHNPAIKTEMIVGRGDVRDEIVDYAKSSGADLVALGSRGLGALKRTFVGSTSDYVVHHCHCPVLVVKVPAARA